MIREKTKLLTSTYAPLCKLFCWPSLEPQNPTDTSDCEGACYFQSGILFHIFKLSWIRNDCSSGIEAEITLAYHPPRPAPFDFCITRSILFTRPALRWKVPWQNPWPFIGPELHQLFTVRPLASNPHEECGGSAGPQSVCVWAADCVGKAATKLMSHPPTVSSILPTLANMMG